MHKSCNASLINSSQQASQPLQQKTFDFSPTITTSSEVKGVIAQTMSAAAVCQDWWQADQPRPAVT
jgi:hypothetical protein